MKFIYPSIMSVLYLICVYRHCARNLETKGRLLLAGFLPLKHNACSMITYLRFVSKTPKLCPKQTISVFMDKHFKVMFVYVSGYMHIYSVYLFYFYVRIPL